MWHSGDLVVLNIRKCMILVDFQCLVAFDLTILATATMCINDASRHHPSSVSGPPPLLSAGACIMSIPHQVKGTWMSSCFLRFGWTLAASSLHAPMHPGDLRGTKCCLQLFYWLVTGWTDFTHSSFLTARTAGRRELSVNMVSWPVVGVRRGVVAKPQSAVLGYLLTVPMGVPPDGVGWGLGSHKGPKEWHVGVVERRKPTVSWAKSFSSAGASCLLCWSSHLIQLILVLLVSHL